MLSRLLLSFCAFLCISLVLAESGSYVINFKELATEAELDKTVQWLSTKNAKVLEKVNGAKPFIVANVTEAVVAELLSNRDEFKVTSAEAGIKSEDADVQSYVISFIDNVDKTDFEAVLKWLADEKVEATESVHESFITFIVAPLSGAQMQKLDLSKQAFKIEAIDKDEFSTYKSEL